MAELYAKYHDSGKEEIKPKVSLPVKNCHFAPWNCARFMTRESYPQKILSTIIHVKSRSDYMNYVPDLLPHICTNKIFIQPQAHAKYINKFMKCSLLCCKC